MLMVAKSNRVHGLREAMAFVFAAKVFRVQGFQCHLPHKHYIPIPSGSRAEGR